MPSPFLAGLAGAATGFQSFLANRLQQQALEQRAASEQADRELRQKQMETEAAQREKEAVRFEAQAKRQQDAEDRLAKSEEANQTRATVNMLTPGMPIEAADPLVPAMRKVHLGGLIRGGPSPDQLVSPLANEALPPYQYAGTFAQQPKPDPDVFSPAAVAQKKDLARFEASLRPAPSGGALTDKADTEALAEMLVTGNAVPAQLSKFGGAFNKAMAAASKLSVARTGKPYNAARAGVEYGAAQRFASSLNSSQMVRFKGLAISVVNTIDEVNRLADAMDLSGVTFANAAELNAKVKVLGNTEQGQLAAQYLGTVYTLREEFANLVNGGYAPTEPAFTLANKQINENFGRKAMHASLNEVQRLINYRVNAFNEVRPVGVDPNNPAVAGLGVAPGAGPAPAPAPARIRYDINGNVIK